MRKVFIVVIDYYVPVNRLRRFLDRLPIAQTRR
jgi:hypothetical protein